MSTSKRASNQVPERWHQDKDGNWVFDVEVRGDDETQEVLSQQKNFKAISEAYGSNSDEWLGKQMRVVVIRTRTRRAAISWMPSGSALPAPRMKRLTSKKA